MFYTLPVGIINRYFLKNLAVFFIMALIVLAGLAWMTQILTMLKFLIQYGVNVWGFLGLTGLMLPFIITIILPFVIFIAVMFVYNRFISDREMTIAMSSGMSPMRAAAPALILAAIVTALHLALNVWVVPYTQVKFYDTQWNMRYGLANMKLQESTFTQMTDGLVVFVDAVHDHDLSDIMLYDARNPDSQTIITANTGKLVNTLHGLSIVMGGGSIQFRDDNFTVGSFDSFDMDMNISDRADTAFRVRRIDTATLFNMVRTGAPLADAKELESVSSELTSRVSGPLMDMILVLICCVALLKSSLLRRNGIPLSAPVAVLIMAVAQTGYMALSDSIMGLPALGALLGVQVLLIACGFLILASDKFQA